MIENLYRILIFIRSSVICVHFCSHFALFQKSTNAKVNLVKTADNVWTKSMIMSAFVRRDILERTVRQVNIGVIKHFVIGCLKDWNKKTIYIDFKANRKHFHESTSAIFEFASLSYVQMKILKICYLI